MRKTVSAQVLVICLWIPILFQCFKIRSKHYSTVMKTSTCRMHCTDGWARDCAFILDTGRKVNELNPPGDLAAIRQTALSLTWAACGAAVPLSSSSPPRAAPCAPPPGPLSCPGTSPSSP